MAATGFTPIYLYASGTAGHIPLAANLTNTTNGSEIALNYADGNLFFKNASNAVITTPLLQASSSQNGWLSSTDWSTFNGKAPAFTYTTSYIPFGQGTTTPAQSSNFVFNGSNLGVGVNNPIYTGDFRAATANLNIQSTTGTNYASLFVSNTGGGVYAGAESSTGNTLFSGTSAYAGVFGTAGAYPVQIATGNSVKVTVFNSGGVSIGNTTDPGANSLSVGSSTGWLYVGSTSSLPSSSVSGTALRNIDQTGPNISSGGSYTGAATHWYFTNGNGNVGSITTNGTSAAFNNLSDYRLKENITPIVNAITKILAINPVTWTWKTDNTQGEGFVAHELANIFPQAVTGKKDDVDAEGNPVYQGVDTSFLIATITKAIQEQQDIIEKLQTRIKVLENK